MKSYAAAGQAMLALALRARYTPSRRASIASGSSPSSRCSSRSIWSSSHVLGLSGAQIGVVFYLWIGLFNLVMVAQFWAFANDVYSPERGKRLFPLVGVGAVARRRRRGEHRRVIRGHQPVHR